MFLQSGYINFGPSNPNVNLHRDHQICQLLSRTANRHPAHFDQKEHHLTTKKTHERLNDVILCIRLLKEVPYFKRIPCCRVAVC